MAYTKGRRIDLNGVFGQVTHADVDIDGHYDTTRHMVEERDINTRETISFQDDTNGLPEGITMDMYFQMALLQRLDEICKAIKQLQPLSEKTHFVSDSEVVVSSLNNFAKYALQYNKESANKIGETLKELETNIKD